MWSGNERERETELSQPLGHTAELGTENKHGSSSKHSYNLDFCVLLIFSVRLSRVPSRALQVPPRVQWEGLRDRGAGSSPTRLHTVQWEGLRDRGANYFFCVPETAVNPLLFVFSSGRIAAGLALRRQTDVTQNHSLVTT